MSKRRINKSAAWHRRQENDVYVKEARAQGYRSRSAYKLLEMDKQHHILRAGMHIIDLGCAPGGWSQAAKKKIGTGGKIVAVDLLLMPPLAGVDFIQGDFTQAPVQQQIMETLPAGADVIISDMAPNLSGIAVRDQANAHRLLLSISAFCPWALKPGGGLLVKAFAGEMLEQGQALIQPLFKRMQILHPKVSRKASRECYILAVGRTSGE